MIKIPVHNTFTTPSQQLTTYLSILEVMAAYAKAAHQTDLFNQLKEQHDKMVTQYNEQNKPKKKGFWEQVKDNLTLNMDTHTTFYLSLLATNKCHVDIFLFRYFLQFHILLHVLKFFQ